MFSLDKCLDDALEYGDICGAEGRGSCAAFVAGLTQSELGCLAAYHRRSDLNAFRVELAYVGVACQGRYAHKTPRLTRRSGALSLAGAL